MQGNGFRNFVLCVLTAAFLVTGLWIMKQRIEKQNTYLDAAEQAEYAAQNVDVSELEALKAEENALSEEISAMDTQMAQLQEEITSLEQNIAQLQQEYDQLAQQEDSVYYQTIFQSLTEGMSLVESYISGDQ